MLAPSHPPRAPGLNSRQYWSDTENAAGAGRFRVVSLLPLWSSPRPDHPRLEADAIEIHVSGPVSPMLFCAEGEDKEFVVVMPYRI